MSLIHRSCLFVIIYGTTLTTLIVDTDYRVKKGQKQSSLVLFDFYYKYKELSISGQLKRLFQLTNIVPGFSFYCCTRLKAKWQNQKIMCLITDFFIYYSMGNTQQNKYPETPEEKQNMQRPFVADKCPKQIQLEVGKDYYYCACGLSKNQPFCDGSHKGSPYTPIKFTAEKADNYLCMCKHSKNMPYCDGTHKSIEF